MNQDIRFCTTSDNVKVAYAVSGEGPPLLMPATWLSHLPANVVSRVRTIIDPTTAETA
jgi:hypothetical protein